MGDSVLIQAGAVAYVVADGEYSFLLVTSRRRPDAWIFPKGHIEEGESTEGCAQRELREEGGVTGTVVAALGPFVAEVPAVEGIRTEVHYFLVREDERGDAREDRQREWLPYAGARARLSDGGTRLVLDAAADRLGLLP